MRADYLVSGLRITLAAQNNSPGPRTHILNFTKALAAAGWQVRVFVVSDMPFMGRFSRMSGTSIAKSSTLKVVAADLVRVGCAVWTGSVTFLRSVGQPSPDFIYERAAVMQSLTSFHASKTKSVRVVEVNGILSRETARDRNALKLEGLAKAIEKHTFRSADLLVAVSAPLKQEIISFSGVPAERILVVPNGIDEEILSIPRSAAAPTIGFVGQLSNWQRLDKLIDAIAHIRDETPELTPQVEIIGDGPARSVIEQRIHEFGLQDHVTLLGRLPQTDAFARMASWSIGFAGHEKSTSSTMYHSPLKIYEYAALGLDVVCTTTDDATSLAESGLRVELYGAERTINEALVAALQLPQRSIAEVEGSRRMLAEAHGWSQRVALVTDALTATRSRIGQASA